MSRLPDTLPKILRDVGLKVVEVDGWRERGRPTGGFDPVGVLCHHTATYPSSSDASVVDLLVRGRSDLPGPLAQLGLARDGTVYVIAAGRANHAGKARASGTVAAGDGNTLYIGIEAFNDGRGERWPQVQLDAYALLCAVLSREVTGNSAQTVRGHKETSTTGKVDPLFDMNDFRRDVARLIETPRTDPQEDIMNADQERKINEKLDRILQFERHSRLRELRDLRNSKDIKQAVDAAIAKLEAGSGEG